MNIRQTATTTAMDSNSNSNNNKLSSSLFNLQLPAEKIQCASAKKGELLLPTTKLADAVTVVVSIAAAIVAAAVAVVVAIAVAVA